AAGYAPAQFQLGEFYKNGTYVDQNPGRARSWFQRAASGGNIFAMHRLGYLYAEGQGGSTDINTAIQWFEDAANYGFVDSMFKLGTIYDPITGNSAVDIQDAEKAYYWYALAALQGDNDAANKAGDLAARLDASQKTRLDGEIADWRARPTNRTANENFIGE
ncbi:MAG: tetratricopeptide repeat protein, partial [Pseudomonadota bacterium]